MAVVLADLERVFGVENVRVWSHLEPDVSPSTPANAQRVADAITAATNEVNDMFRAGAFYVVPLPTTNTVIRDWIATKAGVWLFTSRPAGGGDAAITWASRHEMVNDAIALYQSGGRSFGSDVPKLYTGPTMPYVSGLGSGYGRYDRYRGCGYYGRRC